MQKALAVLKLPVCELAKFIQFQVQLNPLLEYDYTCENRTQSVSDEHVLSSEKCKELDFDKVDFHILEEMDETFVKAAFTEEKVPEQRDYDFPLSSSLFEHLMTQARAEFECKEDLHKAEQIIGSLDSKGFLQEECHDDSILKIIQQFDPPGVAAQNLQESLLIQLSRKEKTKTHAYLALKYHFKDIAEGRVSLVEKKMKMQPGTLLALLRKETSNLNFCPGEKFQKTEIPFAIPDVTLKKKGGNWSIEINSHPLPKVKICNPYQGSTFGTDLQFINSHLQKGRWILQMIQKREVTLKKITEYLLKRQLRFFNGHIKEIHPLTMREVAAELGVHESTITRALANKYLLYEGSIFPYKSFFSSPLQNKRGERVSNQTIKGMIENLIKNEDKLSPLSDEDLSLELSKKGITCARRTVSKYRKALKIESASWRKKMKLSRF